MVRPVARLSAEMRRLIQGSEDSDASLARQLGCSRMTVCRWRTRLDSEDRSHAPQRPRQSLSDGQRRVVLLLRSWLQLSIDDLTVMCQSLMYQPVSKATLERFLTSVNVPTLKTRGAIRRLQANQSNALSITAVPVLGSSGHPSFWVLLAVNSGSLWLYGSAAAKLTVPAVLEFVREVSAASPFKVDGVWFQLPTESALCSVGEIRPRQPAPTRAAQDWVSRMRFGGADFAAFPLENGGVSMADAAKSLGQGTHRHNLQSQLTALDGQTPMDALQKANRVGRGVDVKSAASLETGASGLTKLRQQNRIHWPFQTGLLDDVNAYLSGDLLQCALVETARVGADGDLQEATRWLRAVYRGQGRELPADALSDGRGEVLSKSNTVSAGVLRLLAELLCRLAVDVNARVRVRKSVEEQLGPLIARRKADAIESSKLGRDGMVQLAAPYAAVARRKDGALGDLDAIQHGQRRSKAERERFIRNLPVSARRSVPEDRYWYWGFCSSQMQRGMLELAAQILCVVRVAQDVKLMSRTLRGPSGVWHTLSPARVMWSVLNAGRGICLSPVARNKRRKGAGASCLEMPDFRSRESQWSLVKPWIPEAEISLREQVVQDLVSFGVASSVAETVCQMPAAVALDLVSAQWLCLSEQVRPDACPFDPPTAQAKSPVRGTIYTATKELDPPRPRLRKSA